MNCRAETRSALRDFAHRSGAALRSAEVSRSSALRPFRLPAETFCHRKFERFGCGSLDRTELNEWLRTNGLLIGGVL